MRNLLLLILCCATACSQNEKSSTNLQNDNSATNLAISQQNEAAVEPTNGSVSDGEGEAAMSRQAEFAAEHPNEADCGAPDQLAERLKGEGLSLVGTDDEGTETWKAQDGSRAVRVETSPMESCIVSE